MCSNTYKPTDFRAEFYFPCIHRRKKKKKKKMMNNLGFYKFPTITVTVYFTYFESIIVYRSTRRACSLSEKA